MNMKALSLFANIGIGETYLKDLGIDVVVANELLPSRVAIYQHFHPETTVIAGDITKENTFNTILTEAHKHSIDIIIATPPCQGMSVAGQMKSDDPRNTLIIKAMEVFNQLKPKYMLIENVPQMLKTSIVFKEEVINIKKFIEQEIGSDYKVEFNVFDAADYGTAQHRKRTIVRIYKKELEWPAPIKQELISVEQAIGDLPSLESGESSSLTYHHAKKHNENHILWMKHTPTGKTAFDNIEHYPQKDGRRIKGFSTTYKRIYWDKPSPTITMGNGSISSQNNVHPGRLLPNGTYSDARVLTLLEIIRLTGLPDNWNPPSHISDNILRHLIGEAVPPKMMHAMFSPLIKKS